MEWLRNGGSWEVQKCSVAPQFPLKGMQPAGFIADCIGDGIRRVSQLATINLQDLMLAANNSFKMPVGFCWLSRWVDTIADIYLLQKQPLQLQLFQLVTDSQAAPMLFTEQAQVLGEGHRSLVVRMKPSDNFVIKVSSATNIQHELSMHQSVDNHSCAYIRRAKHGRTGVVIGAGPGLQYMALEPFAARGISRWDLQDSATLLKLAEQVRRMPWLSFLRQATKQ